jgi:nucleotide-binding universal stress UspA family protein
MYRKILVPLDGSTLSETVFPHLKAIAGACPDCEVLLFRVCTSPALVADSPATLTSRWEEYIRQETTYLTQQCQAYLTEIAQKLKAAGLKVTAETRTGRPATEIVEYAQKNQIDLIIMASHGYSGATRWAYGNTANKVLQTSPVPVLLVKTNRIN